MFTVKMLLVFSVVCVIYLFSLLAERFMDSKDVY